MPGIFFSKVHSSLKDMFTFSFCGHCWNWPVAKMKFSPSVTSDLSKNCKKALSCTFSHLQEEYVFLSFQNLRQKYNVECMPIQKDDKVQVGWGHYKGQQICKVAQLYRTKDVDMNTQWVQWEKANGPAPRVDIYPSKMVITKLKLDKNHKNSLNKKPNCTKYKRANIRKKQLRRCKNNVIYNFQ